MTRQSRLGRIGAAAALMLVAGVVLGACSPASSGGGAPESRVRPPSFFYRMQADFILKETGEPIRFDYVVACGGVVENYSYTSPTVFYTHHPIIMFEPVGEGQALGLVTIDMCDDWKWQPLKFGPMAGQSRIPETLRPLAIWFDDVNDLSRGWGYKTDDAYASPLSKIEFLKANVSVSTQEEWIEWRRIAKAEYEQIGALPGPWGYSYSEDSSEVIRAANVRGEGFGFVSPICFASFRVSVDPELVEQIFNQFPDASGRYLLLDDVRDDVPEAFEQLLGRHGRLQDGLSYRDFREAHDNAGTLCRKSTCHILPYSTLSGKRGFAYREVYPYLSRSDAMGELDTPPERYYKKVVLDDQYKGFGACTSAQRPVDSLVRVAQFKNPEASIQLAPFDINAFGKTHELIVDDEVIPNLPRHMIIGSRPPMLIDRRGYLIGPDI